MSFLTPLYLLGALAIALPVVFHMIRRTPSGRQEFSSLMFLEPSPPRITSRSKVEHWLLLLLRAIAVVLIAIAFARPFLRVQGETAADVGDFREVVVLLDTSASMRREGVWDAAVRELTRVIDETEPRDRVELLTFNQQPRVLIDSRQWAELEPSQRAARVTSLLVDVTPGWASTDLGRALIEAAERLDDEREIEGLGQLRRILVISDLQQGSQIETLQAYQWPKHMSVELIDVGQDVSPNNAGLHAGPSEGNESSASEVRIRVTNAANSKREQFTLRWDGASATDADQSAVSVIVPPGTSRVVAVARLPSVIGTSSLVLEGDDHPFDNRCYVGTQRQRIVHVALVTRDAADDPETMRYFAERALLETPERAVVFHPLSETGDATNESHFDLIIITTRPDAETTDRIREAINGGTTALVVPADAQQMRVLFDLLDVSPVETQDANVADYVMLNDIDYTHPLFSELNQPRFSDFTKVRFWKHRHLDAESIPGIDVIARFDDGDIAAGQVAVGGGSVIVFTSSWHLADSQLALSTKFVPMLNGLLDDAAGIVTRPSQFLVGDTVDLTAFLPDFAIPTVLITPSDEEIVLTDSETSFARTDEPGRYRIRVDSLGETALAEFVVNIASTESGTSLLSVNALRAAGVPMDLDETDATTSPEVQRQLHNSELESRQKLWRWIIVAAILILFAETVFASRLTRVGKPT
ncbi:MAG: BatA domain-containing protein [Planctomycetaceae bacterium]|nr:BatA domain-containing protein [Planctomycetaceae bacterium]